MYVRAALYHGDQTLCPVVSTMKGAHPDWPEWNETLEFVIPVTELPRSAKLCFLIYQQKQAGRKRKEVMCLVEYKKVDGHKWCFITKYYSFTSDCSRIDMFERYQIKTASFCGDGPSGMLHCIIDHAWTYHCPTAIKLYIYSTQPTKLITVNLMRKKLSSFLGYQPLVHHRLNLLQG